MFVNPKLQGLLEDTQKQLQNKEQAIQRLTKGLQEKDKHIQVSGEHHGNQFVFCFTSII